MKKINYLFIGGCARSGTSVLTGIVGSHHQIVLGMERYNKLCLKKSYAITREHFSKERFLRMEEGDTFYKDFFRFRLHHNIPDKWENAKYVGVKYPRVDEIIDELKMSLGRITVIYIYRDVFEVAESWNRRAVEGKNWPKEKDYSQAVHMWNKSLSTIKEFIRRGEKIICINYDDLLFSDKPIDQLFRMLDLKMDENVEAQLQSARSKSNEIKRKKGNLIQMEYNFIKEQANMQLFIEFNAAYNILK